MDYEVKITQSGPGGTIYYLENAKELSFTWEFAIDGALVFVPPPPHCNGFCERSDLPQAQGRRGEILEKVGEEIVRQKVSGGKYAIGDEYVSVSFR